MTAEYPQNSVDRNQRSDNQDEAHFDRAKVRFVAAFEPVLVEDPVVHNFDGSVSRQILTQFASWVFRDLSPELGNRLITAQDDDVEEIIDQALPQLVSDIRSANEETANSPDRLRKFIAQVGGDEVYQHLNTIVCVLRCRPLLAKAAAFGRNVASIQDDAALGGALGGLPLKNASTASVLFHALVSHTTQPTRLVSAVLEATGNASEASVRRAGFAPLIEALLAHAQNQVSLIALQKGVFSDVDLICNHVIRFHKLMRAVTGYLELDRGGRWSSVASEITRTMGVQIEPRLREVSADLSQSMRKPREGADKVDSDRLLAALNGVYLLAAVRDARESLALNALFEKLWQETGQSLELLINRNLELYKANPGDENAEKRLDMGIKMAEVRFDADYAEVLRRARESVGRRVERSA